MEKEGRNPLFNGGISSVCWLCFDMVCPVLDNVLPCFGRVLHTRVKELLEVVLEAGKLAILKWQTDDGCAADLCIVTATASRLIAMSEGENHPMLPRAK